MTAEVTDCAVQAAKYVLFLVFEYLAGLLLMALAARYFHSYH